MSTVLLGVLVIVFSVSIIVFLVSGIWLLIAVCKNEGVAMGILSCFIPLIIYIFALKDIRKYKTPFLVQVSSIIGFGLAFTLTFPLGAAIDGMPLKDLPEYVSEKNIETQYSQDISIIKNAILNGMPLGEISLGNDVLEVFATEWGEAVYQKFNATPGRSSMLGKVGAGTITLSGKTIDCLIYEIEDKGTIYWIYFRDSHKSSEQNI